MHLLTLCLQGTTLLSLEHACGRLERGLFKKFVTSKRPDQIAATLFYEIRLSLESVDEVSALLAELGSRGLSQHFGQLRWEELNARWEAARTAQGIT